MQPLSPPVFDKIATHSKNLRFFILVVFAFAFFQLVVIFVDLQIPLGSILAAFGSLSVPFWLHVGPFGSILTPSNRPCAQRPQKHLLFISFHFFRCWIVFKWISADLCIDLGIVFQPNLYHLSPFVFYF